MIKLRGCHPGRIICQKLKISGKKLCERGSDAILNKIPARRFVSKPFGVLTHLASGMTTSTIMLIIFTLATFNYANARPVIADLSLRQIEIDSAFTGTEILLFGARNDAGDVVVVVRGPDLSYVVRKKERVAGIWVNKKQAIFNDVSGFYAVSSSRPLEEIKNDLLLTNLEIGIDNFKPKLDVDEGVDGAEFQKAFVDKQQHDNLYYPVIGEVSFIEDTLFRTIIKIPENIPRGVFTAEVYLFSDGQLIGLQSTPLIVKKKGFDALVFDFAYKYPATYGILAVLIALAAGWGAGVLFRRV